MNKRTAEVSKTEVTEGMKKHKIFIVIVVRKKKGLELYYIYN